jgi:hypothetical protein
VVSERVSAMQIFGVSGAMSAKVEHQIIFVVQLNPKIQEKTSISEYLVECYQMGVLYKPWC